MKTRKLGSEGLAVSALGLGCMGMSYAYGSADEAESIRVLHRALDLGINLWDTAEMYGPFANEALLGRALQGKDRRKVIIATKFAWRFDAGGKPTVLDSSPGHIRESIEGSLRRLNTDYIDLYYQHRLDPKTPIEETMGALAGLVKAGKVRYVGLSEVGPGTVRRAHAVHPLTAVQSEYSLWEREVETKILPTLRRLGIGFVAYSPLGRGFLAGRFHRPDDLDAADWRRTNPRFQGEHLSRNARLAGIVRDAAARHGVTPGQLALAWMLRRGEDVVPIPGTKHVRYLEENAGAAELSLPESAWAALEKELAGIRAAGPRYPEAAMQFIDGSE